MRHDHALRLASFILSLALLTGASSPPDPLLEAVERGDAAGVRALLRGGANPSVARGDGLTALHVAAQTGNLEIARLLIDARADVRAETRIGAYTPLHLAAGRGHADVIDALLDAGADVAARTTSTGVTPLHLAAKAMDGDAAVA